MLATFSDLRMAQRLMALLLASTLASPMFADEWTFEDINGVRHQPWRDTDAKALVLVFITTDCPISNYYQPTLARLHAAYRDRGVKMFLVQTDPDVQRQEALKHAEDFKLTAPVVIDAEQSLIKRVKAKVTPEAFVIDKNGKTLYRGRIDDLYADFGKRRRKPQRNDLRAAIDSVLAGTPIKNPTTKAVGCYITLQKEAAEP